MCSSCWLNCSTSPNSASMPSTALSSSTMTNPRCPSKTFSSRSIYIYSYIPLPLSSASRRSLFTDQHQQRTFSQPRSAVQLPLMAIAIDDQQMQRTRSNTDRALIAQAAPSLFATTTTPGRSRSIPPSPQFDSITPNTSMLNLQLFTVTDTIGIGDDDNGSRTTSTTSEGTGANSDHVDHLIVLNHSIQITIYNS
jgi:hypothetical protein